MELSGSFFYWRKEWFRKRFKFIN